MKLAIFSWNCFSSVAVMYNYRVVIDFWYSSAISQTNCYKWKNIFIKLSYLYFSIKKKKEILPTSNFTKCENVNVINGNDPFSVTTLFWELATIDRFHHMKNDSMVSAKLLYNKFHKFHTTKIIILDPLFHKIDWWISYP